MQNGVLTIQGEKRLDRKEIELEDKFENMGAPPTRPATAGEKPGKRQTKTEQTDTLYLRL
jgi:hypothetical protein